MVSETKYLAGGWTWGLRETSPKRETFHRLTYGGGGRGEHCGGEQERSRIQQGTGHGTERAAGSVAMGKQPEKVIWGSDDEGHKKSLYFIETLEGL